MDNLYTKSKLICVNGQDEELNIKIRSIVQQVRAVTKGVNQE